MNEAPILVPLDGSQLSEAAVSHAVVAAKVLKTGLVLLGVLEPLLTVHALTTQAITEAHQGYRQYLDTLATRVESQGVAAEVDLRAGRGAAEGILESIDERQPRLLVMSTHGRSGITRWVYGSVASRMAHEALVSVLLIGPRVDRSDRAGEIRRILVPLDGSDLAQSALDVAREIAKSAGAEVVLAEAIGWVAQALMLDMPTSTIDQIAEEMAQSARTRLTRAAARLGQPAKTQVLRGPAAQTLLDFVAAESIDLVVMASHCRGGLVRAALGSVADRMLQGSAPVLLVRSKVLDQSLTC